MKQQRYSTQEETEAWEEGLLWGAITIIFIEVAVTLGFILGWFAH